MNKLFLRAYTKPKKLKRRYVSPKDSYKEHKAVFVFDTETTINLKQELKIGYFQLYIEGVLVQHGLFYKDLSNLEKDIVFSYGRKKSIEVYSHKQFIYEIFYPIVFNKKALCLGYNLPFDISRISINHSQARRNEYGGFSFTLSEYNGLPRIKIKQLNSETNIIKFALSTYNREKFQGKFIDVQKLASVLLEMKRISLREVCKQLKTKSQKLEVKEHGKIDENYIDYLITDVRATYEIYLKLQERFKEYQIDMPIEKVYSNASLGKSALRQMGIKSFKEQNIDFPDLILGWAMSAYFGGRTECKIRKEPIKVTTLDFTSTYPTIALIMGIWDFIIADKISYTDCTKEVQNMLETITLEDLFKKETWKNLCVLVEIEPNENILPIRTTYNESENPIISISKITYNKKLYYFLPDVIASKILSDKVPQITKAISFSPEGKQTSLKKTTLLGTEFNPQTENFIKKVVEERQRIKNELPSKASALKIMANATTYGIFIQLDQEDTKQELDIFSNTQFSVEEARIEKTGEFFNPIIGASITSGARLLLAMAEKFVSNKGYSHTYMDSDSIFVPIDIADELSNSFNTLNPYDSKVPLLKIEKRNKWFYGISSKRYVLYNLEGNKVVIEPDLSEKEYKLHGLGHILNPFGKEVEHWHIKIWEDILKLHYGITSIKELTEKYAKFFVISRMTISNYNILNWFKKNPDIKPYSFFLRGIGANGVKPITSFTKDSQKVVYEPFIDIETGKVMQGEEYWKTLDKEILNYLNHPESKFEWEIGLLRRRHVKPTSIVYIGKESNKIGTELIETEKQEIYQNEEALKERILKMSPKEARKLGIRHRSTLIRIKSRIMKRKKVNWKTKEMRKLIS